MKYELKFDDGEVLVLESDTGISNLMLGSYEGAPFSGFYSVGGSIVNAKQLKYVKAETEV